MLTPYFRTERGRSEKSGGTGLGLGMKATTSCSRTATAPSRSTARSGAGTTVTIRLLAGHGGDGRTRMTDLIAELGRGSRHPAQAVIPRPSPPRPDHRVSPSSCDPGPPTLVLELSRSPSRCSPPTAWWPARSPTWRCSGVRHWARRSWRTKRSSGRASGRPRACARTCGPAPLASPAASARGARDASTDHVVVHRGVSHRLLRGIRLLRSLFVLDWARSASRRMTTGSCLPLVIVSVAFFVTGIATFVAGFVFPPSGGDDFRAGARSSSHPSGCWCTSPAR